MTRVSGRPAALEREGLRITLKRKPGLTAPGILKAPFHFQLPPIEEFSWEETFSWQDWDTAKSGQFSRPGGRQLISCTFQQIALDYDPYMLPGDVAARQEAIRNDIREGRKTPAVAGHDNDDALPHTQLARLRRLERSGTPFIFVVANPTMIAISRPVNRDEMTLLNMLATLRSIRPSDKAGEPDALYFNLSVTEYRLPTEPRIAKAGGGKSDGYGKRAPGVDTQVVFVPKLPKRLRTLRALSIWKYGTASQEGGWGLIRGANPAVRRPVNIGPEEDLLEFMLRYKVSALTRSGGRLVLPGSARESGNEQADPDSK